MAVDPLFAEAFLSGNHVIYGLKLKPFSYWHRFLLQVGLSPVLAEEDAAPLTRSDLYKFCKVCTLSFPNTIKITWLDKIRLRLKGKTTPSSLKDYIEDHCSFPEFWEDNSDNKASGGKSLNDAPEPLPSVVALMALGYKENEAWDMPIGKGAWVLATYAKQQGAELSFLTQEEREMFELLKTQESKDDVSEQERQYAEELMRKQATGDLQYITFDDPNHPSRHKIPQPPPSEPPM